VPTSAGESADAGNLCQTRPPYTASLEITSNRATIRRRLNAVSAAWENTTPSSGARHCRWLETPAVLVGSTAASLIYSLFST